jgi:hypothetical protein
MILQHCCIFTDIFPVCQGDYFAAVLPEGANRSVVIHQLSKWRSQIPFSKAKGQVQCLLFHPIRYRRYLISIHLCLAVLRNHDILVLIRIRIWIRGSMPLTNESGS